MSKKFHVLCVSVSRRFCEVPASNFLDLAQETSYTVLAAIRVALGACQRKGTRMRLFVIAILFAVLVSSLALIRGADASSPSAQMLANPGFEKPFTALPASAGKARITGSVAHGWVDDSSWADVTVAYGEAKSGAHSGSSAQSITVKAVRSGDAQFAQWLPLTPNHSYALSIWLKGKPGASASVILRLAPPPYTVLGRTQVTLTGIWQHVKVSANSKNTTQGGFMIFPPTGSTLYVDDASLTDVTGSKSGGHSKIQIERVK